MTEPMLELRHVFVSVNRGSQREAEILHDISLTVMPRDFITVIGTNGAGKSTLFNTIAGHIRVKSGTILHLGQDITKTSEEQRTRFLARVFQDPKLGTAPRMTVAENLLLAEGRGQHHYLTPRHLQREMPRFRQLTGQVENGLKEKLNTATESLSGGQRQSLSFLMATIKPPDLLLLDEHTAALDPNSSQQLLDLTSKTVHSQHLTTLMITHHMDDALKYGNRLIVLKSGRIVANLNAAQKKKMTVQKLYHFFE